MDPSIWIFSFIKIDDCFEKWEIPDVFYTLESILSNRFRRKHPGFAKNHFP